MKLGTALSTVLLASLLSCVAFGQTYTISTFAGSGVPGFGGDNGPATTAQLVWPLGVAVDSAGNVYIADTHNNRIRKVSNGVIASVAGNGSDGFLSGDNGPSPATSADLGEPLGIAVDSAGNFYFTEFFFSGRVRKVASGEITTVADGNGTMGFSGDNGPAINAELTYPFGVAVDSAGNLYIADMDNNRVRKVSNGIITTVAGGGTSGLGDNGPATSAQLNQPIGVAVDSAGNLYIADSNNYRVRKVANGIITTVAGDGQLYFVGGALGDNGPATSGHVQPIGIAVDSAGNLYIVDGGSSRIRMVSNGVITTIAGNGILGFSGDNGPAISAQLNNPVGVAVDSAGNLYIADQSNNRIRLLTPTPATSPAINQSGGVVSGGSFQAGIASNSWVTIFGTNLSSKTDTWANAIMNGALPMLLDGVSVSIGGAPAYINYISPTQINAVAPKVGTGTVSVTVTNSNGTSSAITTAAHTVQPAFFQWGTYAVATEQDYSLAVKNGTFAGVTTAPAKPGDVIILWGTGFGPTNPSAPVGVEVPSITTYNTASPVTVTVGGVPATVYGAALASGFAGLYQVAIQIPTSLANGDFPVIANISGAQSPSTTLITVQD